MGNFPTKASKSACWELANHTVFWYKNDKWVWPVKVQRNSNEVPQSLIQGKQCLQTQLTDMTREAPDYCLRTPIILCYQMQPCHK